MKNTVKILLAIVCSTVFSVSASAQAKKTEKAVIKTTIHCDHCKACETCGKSFQSEMLKIKGVKMYDLNPEAGQITVFYNPQKTNLKTIRTAITKLGYDADELRADPEAYEKLDGCCKKA